MRMKWLLLLILLFSCQSNKKGTSDESNTEMISEYGCELKPLSIYQVVDKKGDTLYLKDLIEEDPILFVTYTESVCRSCLEEYFELLHGLADGEIDRRKVVFIAQYQSLRNIRIDSQASGFEVYNFINDEQCPEINQFMEQYVRLILVNDELEIIHNRYGFPGDSLSNPDFQKIITYLK